MEKLKHNGILLMIISALFFSFMGALVKYTTRDIPFMEAVFFRAFATLLILTPWMGHKKISFFGHNKLLLFLRSVSGLTAIALSFYVISETELATASILNHTSILFVALLSAIFLKEQVTRRLVLYIGVAFVGAAFIIKPGFAFMNKAALLGLAAGFFASIAYVSIKALHKSESFFTIVFNFSFYASLGAFILGYKDFVLPSFVQWTALIGLGLFGTVAQLLMTYSYKYTDASIVSPFSFAGVFFSFTWGILFWGEIPDLLSLLGALLIIVAGIGILKMNKARGENPELG